MSLKRFTRVSLWITLTASLLPTVLVAETSSKFLPDTLAERNLRFNHIDTLAGLSHNSVLDIVQDRYGFIWIATEEGLNRYDGHRIEEFERVPGDPTSLTHNWIFTLVVARNEELWIGTDGGGVNIYDAKSDAFRALRHDPNDSNSISSDRIRVLLQDRAGAFWVGTDRKGLNRIDPKTGDVTRYHFDEADPASLPNDDILSITETRSGGLWIGTNGGGLARYEPATDGFTRYQPVSDTAGVLGTQIAALHEDRDGNLWIGTRDAGLSQLDTTTGKFVHFPHDKDDPLSLSSNYVRDILEDSDGTLWIATEAGLNERRPNQGFVRYTAKNTDNTSLSENRLSNLFQSADGVLWIGSYKGVSTWNYLSDAFVHYRKGDGFLTEDVVTSIGESSTGQLWIATYGGGITRIDRTTNEVLHLKHDRRNDNSLSSDRVMTLFVDTHDVVWAGTRSQGLNSYDPATGQFNHFRAPVLSSNRVSAIHADIDGTLWVGTFGGGLNRIDATDQTNVTQYRFNSDDSTSLAGDRVLAIMRDRSGTLWVGTEDGGLNRFNADSETFEHFRHDPENSDSLSADTAWEITETSDGSLWIATKDDGLNQWRPEDRRSNRPKFKKWTKAQGLSSNTIYGLLEDNLGQLWLSSNRGITRINLSDYGMRHYDRRDGLAGDEFNWGARWRSRMGQLVFGGNSGAVALSPGLIRNNPRVPHTVVSASSPFKQLALSYSGQESDVPARLEYSDNYVLFEFTALDFNSPDKNQFRIMFEGIDSDWQDPGTARQVKYVNLPTGEYVFRVKVANSDGIWNEDGGSIPVFVAPPPWATTWAFSLYGIVIVLAAIFAFRFYRAGRHREALQRAYLANEVEQRTSELGERNAELEALNRKLTETSFTDSLTGLYNRRYMDQFINQQIEIINRECYGKQMEEVADYSRYQQNVLFFMMIDLDGFKLINDNYGHSAGDKALLQIRDQLLGCMRQGDTVIRWGGDEFLVIGQTKGIAGIANLAERICVAVDERVYDLGDGNTGNLSCSVGAVPYPFAPLKTKLLNWEQSLNIADACAYVIKSNGRNGWMVLNGSESLSEQDAGKLPGNLAALHQSGSLNVVTSLKEPLNLQSKQMSVA